MTKMPPSLRRAIRPGSASGPDGVTNIMLRNLDEPSISALTEYFNYFWERSTLPSEWKHAKVTLIPKPGKPLTIDHLRSISLTSCIGKVLEHSSHPPHAPPQFHRRSSTLDDWFSHRTLHSQRPAATFPRDYHPSEIITPPHCCHSGTGSHQSI